MRFPTTDALASNSQPRFRPMVVSTAENNDKKFDEFPTVFVVQRDGVPLLYVKKPHAHDLGIKRPPNEVVLARRPAAISIKDLRGL